MLVINNIKVITNDTLNNDSLVGSAGTAVADSLEDTLNLIEGNRWINITVNEDSDSITLSHYAKGFVESTGALDYNNTKEKTFDIEGVRISLPNNMISYDSEQYNIYLANNDLLFLGIKETFTSLNSIGLNSDSTLEEYAEVIKQVNNTSSFIKKDNYMYYMKTENIENQNYDYVIVVKKSEDSFWLFNFAYLTSNKSVLQDKVFEYINTIEFY